MKITLRIKDIMSFAKCDAERAREIEYQMDCNGIDYSECTTREFNSAIKDAIVDLDYSIEDLEKAYVAEISVADKLAEMRANGVFK